MLEKLPKLFCPSSVAVIGASDSFDKLGYHVMKSLVEGKYQGQIYPINPRRQEIWGIRSYASLEDVPAEVELAVIAVPAEVVPKVLEECGRKGIQGVVLITAGLRELEDPRGATLQEEIRQVAAQWSLPIIGPNTFGFVNLPFSLNASFTEDKNIDGIIFLAMYASANLALVKTMRDYLTDRRSLGWKKPLIACFAAPPGIWWEDIRAMDKAGMVVLPTPERATRAMGALWRVRQLRVTEKG